MTARVAWGESRGGSGVQTRRARSPRRRPSTPAPAAGAQRRLRRAGGAQLPRENTLGGEPPRGFRLGTERKRSQLTY